MLLCALYGYLCSFSSFDLFDLWCWWLLLGWWGSCPRPTAVNLSALTDNTLAAAVRTLGSISCFIDWSTAAGSAAYSRLTQLVVIPVLWYWMISVKLSCRTGILRILVLVSLSCYWGHMGRVSWMSRMSWDGGVSWDLMGWYGDGMRRVSLGWSRKREAGRRTSGAIVSGSDLE